MTKIAVYDNPAMNVRELWQDGILLAAVHGSLFVTSFGVFAGLPKEIDCGSFLPGRIIGDEEAIPLDRPQTP